MDFRNFSCLPFYAFLDAFSSNDLTLLNQAFSAYESSFLKGGGNVHDKESLQVQLGAFRSDPAFSFLSGSEEAMMLKEPFFRLAKMVSRASIDWQSREAVEALWLDPTFWEAVEKPASVKESSLPSLSFKQLISQTQRILEREFAEHQAVAFDFFNQLWKKGFLSPQENQEMEKLQEAIRRLSGHKEITESHKVQGLREIRAQMKDFGNTLPINARQITAFLSLSEQIKAGLDHFQSVTQNLAKIKDSLSHLTGILGEDKIPLAVYRDWLGVVKENKRELQKTVLLTDSLFLNEIFRYLHREGWSEELFNLVPNRQDLHRLELTYPDQWQDVVDVHGRFGSFVKRWGEGIKP